MNFSMPSDRVFSHYANGGGRASRSEYWYWALFETLVSIVTLIADVVLLPSSSWSPIETVCSLALFLPSLAVSIRRLHDIGRSGYWVLIAFTGVGLLLLLYWACLKGADGDNDYGSDPLQVPPGAA